jgi:hypothetical protein
VSKVANWGRWVIAACLTTDFAVREWRAVPAAIDRLRSAPMAWHAVEFVGVELTVILFWLAVVNGLLTWENSARIALLVFYSLILVAFVLRIVLRSPHQLSKLWPVNLGLAFGTLIWLLLPTVRTEFCKSRGFA